MKLFTMKAYKKLDKTLDYLIAHKDPYGQQSSEIHNNLHVAQDQTEQHLILEKLVEDGYAVIIVPQNVDKEYRNDPFYIISFNGMVFKENGAYEVEFSIRHRELRTRKIISWLNPAWRIVAFITAILTLIFVGIKAYIEIIHPILNT